MKILVIGIFVNDKELSKLNLLSKDQDKPSVAAIKYTKLISEGFKNILEKNVTNLFLAPMGMFPICKKIIWHKKSDSQNYYIPFINFFILKQFIILVYVFLFASIWILKNSRKDKLFIVFTSLYLPFLAGILPLKLFRCFNIVSFVPDLPDFEFTYSNNITFPKSIFINTYTYLSKKLLFIIDYFVFITEFMKEKFNSKPSIVIEGFVDSSLIYKDIPIAKKENAVLYSGALFEKFGIKILLDAFLDGDLNCELWLFGDGDMVEEINKRALCDSRIKYFGQKPNEMVINYQQRAKLLVNPRFSNNEFTKFSFPSKLMEYMISGTPVLTTNLAGIPNDYHDKMFFIELETVDGLKQSLMNCLSKTQEELDLFGKNTKSYVMREKNNFSQMKKIVEELGENF